MKPCHRLLRAALGGLKRSSHQIVRWSNFCAVCSSLSFIEVFIEISPTVPTGGILLPWGRMAAVVLPASHRELVRKHLLKPL